MSLEHKSKATADSSGAWDKTSATMLSMPRWCVTLVRNSVRADNCLCLSLLVSAWCGSGANASLDQRLEILHDQVCGQEFFVERSVPSLTGAKC